MSDSGHKAVYPDSDRMRLSGLKIMKTLFLIPLLCSSVFSATLFSIACGSLTDSGFSAGYSWTAKDQPALGSQSAPYNAMRVSSAAPFTYTVAAQPGQQSVTLRFIEPNKTGPGQRVFTVSINGAVVLNNLDLYAVAGLLVPVSYSFPIPGVAATIGVWPVKGNAVISGIQIDGAAPLTLLTPSYLIGKTEADQPATCPTSGLTFFVSTDTQLLFWCAPGFAGWQLISDGRGIQFDSVPILGTLKNGECSYPDVAWSLGPLAEKNYMRGLMPPLNCTMK